MITVAIVSPPLVAAQAGFREHKAGFGIYIALPGGWIADSETELSTLREGSLNQMRSSGLPALRDFAARNENALLFRARDPSFRTTSISLNVTVNSELKRGVLTAGTPDELSGLVKSVCEAFMAQARDAGGSAKCLHHELVTLEDRGVLLIHQEAVIPKAGLDNRRLVAMLPSDGLLFTLSLSLAKSRFDLGVARAVLASIRFPPEL